MRSSKCLYLVLKTDVNGQMWGFRVQWAMSVCIKALRATVTLVLGYKKTSQTDMTFPPQHGDLHVMNIPSVFLFKALWLHPHHRCLFLMPDSGIMVRNSWWLIHMHSAKLLCGLSSVKRELRNVWAITVSGFTLQDTQKSLWCPWIRELHLLLIFSKPVLTWCSACVICEEAMCNFYDFILIERLHRIFYSSFVHLCKCFHRIN